MPNNPTDKPDRQASRRKPGLNNVVKNESAAADPADQTGQPVNPQPTQPRRSAGKKRPAVNRALPPADPVADSQAQPQPRRSEPAQPRRQHRQPARPAGAGNSAVAGVSPAVGKVSRPGTQPAAGSGRTERPNRGDRPGRTERSGRSGSPGPSRKAAPLRPISEGPVIATIESRKPRKKKAEDAIPGLQLTGLGDRHLRVIPLGGMREIGKNMTVYEYGDEMIVVDCGIAFPDEDMPGIDVVIPDFSYIQQNLAKLQAVFVTHGHEDHIGALPWFCKEFQVPVYGNRLSIELVRSKLDDRGTGVTNARLVPVRDGDVVTIGSFSVEFIHVNHSIADANALVVRTPAGAIYHSGDFKVDHTPINGGPMDLARIGAIGDEGVLLMVCESTNIERKGYTPSESKVGETFAELFANATGRIFVTTFSSNVSRVQQIFTAAEQYGRKVALIGRSMLNVFNAANGLGYITMQPDTLIDANQIDRFAADQLVLITTGSQGEPMSALTRMAFSEHRTVEIVPGDTVILSSSAIPGNEKSVYRVINELYKRGAKVIYESLSEIHVSGHAYQEEIKLLHNLVRPRYFIPAHGEYRHLYRHAELAHQLGTAWENIFLLNNGDIFEFEPQADKARISGFTNAAGVLIDGASVGDIDNLVLRDRRLLADDGVVAVFIAINKLTGEFLTQPDIQARGFIYESESDRVIKECQKKLVNFSQKTIQAGKPLAAVIRSGQLRDQLRDLLFERTRRRPVILISVFEV